MNIKLPISPVQTPTESIETKSVLVKFQTAGSPSPNCDSNESHSGSHSPLSRMNPPPPNADISGFGDDGHC